MNKTKIENKIYDVISEDEYKKNKNLYDPSYTAIQRDDMIFPLRKNKDTSPGYYSYGVIGFYKEPTENIQEYNIKNLINFSDSKSIKDILEKTANLREMEKAVLTDADNIFIPKIKELDEPEMVAFKEAVISKHIDINKYKHRFGDKYNNDLRKFEENRISLPKLKSFANALDMKLSLIIEDKSPDVPNPMNKKITVVLNDGDDDTNE